MNNFLEFVADIFNVEVSTLSMDTEYGSIPQWDSLMHIRLLAEIEQTYNVEIPYENIDNIRKLKDFYAFINEEKK